MTSEKALNIIYAAVKERYNFEIDRIRHLDNKANNVMSIAGILATLVSGLASLSVTASVNALDILVLAAFVTCLCLLFESFYLGLRAYQIRSYTIVPDPPILIGEGEKMEASKIAQTLCDNYALATEENMGKNEEKVSYTKVATWLVLGSLVSFAVFAFFTILGRN